MRTCRLTMAALAVATAVVVAGCGGGGDKTSTGSGALGSPGDPAKAGRTVEVQTTDALRFRPDNVQVKVGETVTFHVVNVAASMHDFTLGDEDMQSEHEREMRSMSSGGAMNMGDDANAIHIPPGESKDLTWTFTKAGTTYFGCHEPGHYDSGMRGTIVVS